jgi:hypothetical protein
MRPPGHCHPADDADGADENAAFHVSPPWERPASSRFLRRAMMDFPTPQPGPKIPVPSLAACAARRRSSGHWASTLRSVVKAEPEAGSSGCVQLSKIPSALSAASETTGLG